MSSLDAVGRHARTDLVFALRVERSNRRTWSIWKLPDGGVGREK